MGRWLILAGLLLITIGVVNIYAPWLVNWFGKLPGDIRIEGSKGTIYIPVTSMILVSIVFTIIINLFRR